MKVQVTGASGYLWSTFADVCVKHGYDVVRAARTAPTRLDLHALLGWRRSGRATP